MNDEEFENMINRKYAMNQFLDEVANNETAIVQLMEILKSKNDTEFLEFASVMGFEEFTMQDFISYWSSKEFEMTVRIAFSVYTMTQILDAYYASGRLNDILALLSGDKEAYERIRQEEPILRDNIDATYDWFYNFIEYHFDLRYLYKMNGVDFPVDDDDDDDIVE